MKETKATGFEIFYSKDMPERPEVYEKDGKGGYTRDFEFWRMRNAYRKLFPWRRLDSYPEKIRSSLYRDLRSLHKIDPMSSMLITSEHNVCREVMTHLMYARLRKTQRRVSYEFLHVDRLVDIHEGRDEDYRSVHDLYRKQVVIIHWGYGVGHTPKFLSPHICKAIGISEMEQETDTWLFYCGTKKRLDQGYPDVLKAMEDHGLPIIEIGGSSPDNITDDNRSRRKARPGHW